VGRYASWGLREGEEIAPGRHAVRLLGGGDRHEAYLAFDGAAGGGARTPVPNAGADAASRAPGTPPGRAPKRESWPPPSGWWYR